MVAIAAVVKAYSIRLACGAICLKSVANLSRRNRLSDWIIIGNGVFGELSSSKPSEPACIIPLKVLRKLVAWQFCPLAFSSMSTKKPSSQSRQFSKRHDVAVWLRARLRMTGVNRYNWSSALAYELMICVSNPE